MKCKHKYGWVTEEGQTMYVFPNGKVKVGFKGRNKAIFICNNPDCKAKRNGYVSAKVKYGKITYSKEPEKEEVKKE